MTCCFITFVGLIKIAIKKISVKQSVKPIIVQTISAHVTANILAIHTSINDEQQDRFELQVVQSHSRIINVAPIHLEEQNFESLDNNFIMEPINSQRESNEFSNSNLEVQEEDKTPEVSYQQDFINNQKFNPNLISFAGLALFFMIIVIVGPIIIWHIRFADDFESFVFQAHIYYCLPLALPTVYFIVNPRHLIKATILLFEVL